LLAQSLMSVAATMMFRDEPETRRASLVGVPLWWRDHHFRPSRAQIVAPIRKTARRHLRLCGRSANAIMTVQASPMRRWTAANSAVRSKTPLPPHPTHQHARVHDGDGDFLVERAS